jgi:hypothetical protein
MEYLVPFNEESPYYMATRALDLRTVRYLVPQGTAKRPLQGLALFTAGDREAPVSEEAPRSSSAVETSWIAFEVVDAEGYPAKGEKYKVELPDGSIREGWLGSNGSAHLANIPKGTCKISFPNLDSEVWDES